MMSKELREIYNKIDSKKVEAKALIASGNLDDARKLTDEITNLRKEADIMQELEIEDKGEIANKLANEGSTSDAPAPAPTPIKDLTAMNSEEKDKLEVKAFAKALAGKQLTDIENSTLSSNRDSEGGYVIPKDVRTRINELEKEHVSLRSLVSVEPVSTLSGSRVLEVDADTVGFEELSELEVINKMNGPKFELREWKIRTLGGLMPIPKDLLDDETGGLVNYLASWILRKRYATDNKMILHEDGSNGSQGIIGCSKLKKDMNAGDAGKFFERIVTEAPITYKEVKSIVNKGFRRPIAKKSKIVTNQSGLDHFDGLEDKNGRPYLTGDGTEAFPYKFKGRVIEVYDDETLPNMTREEVLGDTDELTKDDELVPFIIGCFKSALKLYDRKKTSVKTSSEAGFTTNSVLLRAIVRQDTRIWDDKALKVVFSPVDEA
jgi:HK97 family phage major capsid protein